MSFFLFHPRVLSLPALASIRSTLKPNNGLFRAVVTKVCAISRPSSSSVIRVRKFSSKTSGKPSPVTITWRILRFAFIGTGLLFWCIVGLALVTGRVEFHSQRPVNPAMQAAIFQLDDQEITPSFDSEISEEVRDKLNALTVIWSKLKSEEAFLKKFGKNVNITGYKVQYDIPTGKNNKTERGTNEDPELLTEDKHGSNVPKNNRDKWNVTVYIEGSESSGLVTMEFHRVNNNDTFWVPVFLLVETMPSSGVKICEISAPLPNGLTRFSRLFNDQ